MRKSSKYFKARQDLAVSISEHLFHRCEKPPEKKIRTETVNEFLKRGGKITILPPERR